MTNAEIGKRIKDTREELKITREELADKAGISTKFLYEVENGRKGISAETLFKLSKALSCSCDYILVGKEQGNYGELGYALKNFNQKQIKKIGEIIKLILVICKEK